MGAASGTIALPALDAGQARVLVEQIRVHLDGARQLLLELHDRLGWKALGYASWQECVEAEFGTNRRAANYSVEAARIERELGKNFAQPLALQNGVPLKDWHLRQIGQLPSQQQAEIARELAGSTLTIKSLRRVIAHKQAEARELAAASVVQIDRAAPEPGDDLRWRIEVGDARAVPLDEGEAQLVVTSPPYNSRIAYANYLDWLPWQDYWEGLIEPALRECYRILCPGGRLCLNLPNVVRQDVPEDAQLREQIVYRSNSGRKWAPPGANGRPWSLLVEEYLYPLAREIGFLPRERIQWVKGAEPETVTTPSTAWGTFASARNPVLRAVGEPVYVFSKERYDRPDEGLSDISAEDYKRDSRNVWFVPAVGLDPTSFPASFPIELPRRLMRLYSYVGDLVVDPFVGSGTTIRAALETGRRGYGCDIDPDAVRLALERVRK